MRKGYIVYASFLQGKTCVMFEEKPIGTPDAGMIEEHSIKTFFGAPTAFRAIKKEDPNCQLLNKYNLSSLKYLFLAGERCDPNTLEWITSNLPKNLFISDHWWQTETGWPITGRMLGDKIINKLPQCVSKHIKCLIFLPIIFPFVAITKIIQKSTHYTQYNNTKSALG